MAAPYVKCCVYMYYAALRCHRVLVLLAYLGRRAAHSVIGWNVNGYQPINIYCNGYIPHLLTTSSIAPQRLHIAARNS